MADEIAVRSQETSESGENPEQTAARRLDDATLEPQALIEQTGDYRQSEAIQKTFMVLMDNTASEAAAASGEAPQDELGLAKAIAEKEDTVAGREPSVVEGVFEKGSGGSGGDDATITPINLPEVGVVAAVPPSSEAALPQDDTVAGREPIVVDGVFEKSSGGDDGGGEDITPINLPNVQMSAASEVHASARIPETEPSIITTESETAAGKASAHAEARSEKISRREDASMPVIPISPLSADSAGESAGYKIAGGGMAAKFDESTQAATLRQAGEGITAKFDEGGQAVPLRQAGAGQSFKFDEATQAAALRQAGEGITAKFDEGGQAAVLRQAAEGQAYKFEEGVQAATLRQAGEGTATKNNEGGEAAPLSRARISTGGEIPESEMGERLRQAEEIGLTGKSRMPAGSRQSEAGVSQNGGQSSPSTKGGVTETSSPLNTGEGPGTTAATAAAADTDLADSAEKNLSEGEASPEWTPPEMYVTIGPDGECIVVDANGDPIDSPPIVKQIAGDQGQAVFIGKYAGLDSDILFWIPYLERDFQGCTVGFNPDGELTVFDANGKALSAQPMLQKTFDASGDATYMVYNVDSSGNTSPITLYGYTGSLSGVSIYKTESGKLLAVDTNGEPLAVQPHIDISFAQTGEDVYNVWYPTSKNLMSKPVVLTAFTASLEGVSVHVDSNGKTTAVNKDGNPLTAQPKILDLGDGSFRVFYPGSKDQISTASYSASLEGVTIHKGADGTLTAYDTSGKALASQPIILIDFDQQGNEVYRVWYGKSEYVESSQVTVGAYNASLQNVHVSLDQNGNPVAVDENGKPLDAQPLFQKIEGMADNTVFRAYYPGGQSVLIDYYLPKSGGSGTSQYLWK